MKEKSYPLFGPNYIFIFYVVSGTMEEDFYMLSNQIIRLKQGKKIAFDN